MNKKQQRADIVLRELKRLYPNSKTVLNFSNDWELLVAVMLSAQTTDKHVNVVTEKFFRKYSTIAEVAKTSLDEITQNLNSVNYYKTKAKHVHASANKLLDEYDGKLPQTMKDMISLPGVGRKTALVVLGNAHNIVEGIAVDTHVNRLSQVFGLTEHNNPDKIERDLKELFPVDEWFSLTNRMIDYGREYCHARCKHAYCPIVLLLKQNNLL